METIKAIEIYFTDATKIEILDFDSYEFFLDKENKECIKIVTGESFFRCRIEKTNGISFNKGVLDVEEAAEQEDGLDEWSDIV